MTRTRWLLTLAPCLASVAAWTALCVVMVIDARAPVTNVASEHRLPPFAGPLLLATVLLPLAAVVPA